MPVLVLRRGLIAVLVAGLCVPVAAQAYGPTTVRARLARQMRYVGGASGAYAIDLTSGRVLFSSRPDAPRVPASVEKLYTTSTALLRFGPSATFATRVMARGTLGADGVLHGNLWLRGGGDPTLSDARIVALAARLRAAGLRRVDGRVLGDESLFDSLRGSAETGGAPDGYIEGLLSAVAVDRGFSHARYQDSPPRFAALKLAGALRARGVPVTGHSGVGITPADATALASTSSPTVASLTAQTLGPSDNFYAETLLKDLGARFGGAGTTSTGARVVLDQVSRLGLLPQVVDGSGLSRSDRTSPRQVVQLLRAMTRTPVAAALRTALPVAGVSGTLVHRMRGSAAAGRCTAKTGTLTGVSALAGYCPTRDHHLVAFAWLMNGVSVYAAHRAQDAMTVSLAGSTLP